MRRQQIAVALLGLVSATSARADPDAGTDAGEHSNEAIADKLSNPLADQMSLLLENDAQWGDAFSNSFTLQWLLPVRAGEDWFVFSRTSIPIIHASTTGVGNSTESLFLSPARSQIAGVTWGAGPIFGLPASSMLFGTTTSVGFGPTAAIVDSTEPFTASLLAHQLWWLDGSGSSLYLQPELALSLGSAGTTARVDAEATYDWRAEQWTVPVILTLAQVVHVEDLPIEFSLGPIAYLARPGDAPRWGIRLDITLVVSR